MTLHEIITVILAIVFILLLSWYYNAKIRAIRSTSECMERLKYHEGVIKGWNDGARFSANIREADEIMRKYDLELGKVVDEAVDAFGKTMVKWNDSTEAGK